jgi:hypothetical protein
MSNRVHGSLKPCAECGNGHPAKGDFCATACKDAFNNRRKARGAEMYDLYMAHRFERPLATSLGVFQAINRLASNWRSEDHELRASRKSWRPVRQVMEERIYLKAMGGRVRAGR